MPSPHRPDNEQGTSDDKLTAHLAQHVMGWKIAPDRFIKPGRSWCPRWHFQPFEDLADAFQLLHRAADKFTLTGGRSVFTAVVQVGGCPGEATGEQMARTIATAICRALGEHV